MNKRRQITEADICLQELSKTWADVLSDRGVWPEVVEEAMRAALESKAAAPALLAERAALRAQVTELAAALHRANGYLIATASVLEGCDPGSKAADRLRKVSTDLESILAKVQP